MKIAVKCILIREILADLYVMQRRSNGFTLAESIVVLLITSILITISLPVISKRLIANNQDVDVLTCIKKEIGSDLSSSACSAAIRKCQYGMNQACQSVAYYMDHGKNSYEITAARKILSAACDKGGTSACFYITDSCKRDSDMCDIGGFTYDLHNYLSMALSSNNVARSSILKIAGAYYDADNPNIVNAVDNACCNPELNWACKIKNISFCPQKIGGNREDEAYAITIDKQGNSYVTGTEISDGGGETIFILKYNSSGTLQWQKKITYGTGWGIAVDNSGNVYVTGDKSNDAYLLKLDSSGALQWYRRIYGGGFEEGTGVGTDNSGNVYITGRTQSDRFGGTNVNAMISMKFNSSGTLQWQKKIGTSTGNYKGYSLAVDAAGNSYITGYETTSSATEKTNIFILKLNSDGVIQWQKKVWGVEDETGYGITLDNSQNIYVTGNQYSYPFDGSTIRTMFALKLTNSGTLLWQKRIGSSTVGYTGSSIAADNLGNSYIASGKNFVFKLGPTGDPVWYRKFGTSAYAEAIASDSSGNNYTAGLQCDDVYNTEGYCNILVLKLASNQKSNMILLNDDLSLSITDTNFSCIDMTLGIENVTTYTSQDMILQYGPMSPALFKF